MLFLAGCLVGGLIEFLAVIATTYLTFKDTYR